MSYAAQFGAFLELPVHLCRSHTLNQGIEMARHGEFARSVGQAVSVRYIDPFSNRGLGASLGAATRRLDDGARFLVTVVP